MIYTALKDLHYVERFLLRWMIFVLRWMICIALNDLYYVEWFALRWIIWAKLQDLHSVELTVVQHWIICTTLNDFYNVERFFTSLQNLCELEWFVQRWKTCTSLNEWFGFLMSASCNFLMMQLCCTTAPFIWKSQRKRKNYLLINEWKSWKWEISPD